MHPVTYKYSDTVFTQDCDKCAFRVKRSKVKVTQLTHSKFININNDRRKNRNSANVVGIRE